MKKININDPKAWQELDWSEPVQPEALKKTDAAVNRVRGAFIKKDNPAFKQKMKQVATDRKTTSWIDNQRQGCRNRDNSYQARSNSNPEVQQKISDSMKNYQKTDAHNEKVCQKNKERVKPCITPLGIFPSGKVAGEAYNKERNSTNGKNAVSSALIKKKEGYRYISIEEYILLTGRDPTLE